MVWGTKADQRQTWDEGGRRLPVTVVKTFPMTVTQVKTTTTDGYQAIQFGFGRKKGQFKREMRVDDVGEFKLGTTITATQVLSPGDVVKVSGVSRGKGFGGVVKRWGFKGGPKTHGQSDRLRAPGSIGQGTDPGRVHKGKHMPGRLGGKRVTVRNLTVLKVEESGEVWVSGQVPGSRRNLVAITRLRKDRNES
ncbi:MAG: 50S ribosomal protein L3 [Candidatus Chisholmbacteria bacterium]|nr:50S ribosomal protein L3 [Candidatus Chisholmbacteria bacterium]